MNTNIFRAYDIRGIYGKELTEESAELVGKSFGTFIGEEKTLLIARDTRESGETLKKSLIKGLSSVGCNVIDIGVVPTAATALMIINKNFDGGIVISASHNTAEWNGFIPLNNKGLICSEGFGMEKIKEIFVNKNFTKPKSSGKISALNIDNEFTNLILNKVHVDKKFNIVLDVRGGATARLAPAIFSKAGCSVTTINGNIDGKFSGQKPDVTEDCLTDLKETVIKNNADVGIAFDADGDRAAFVDNKGRYCGSGNVTIAMFAEYYLKKNHNGKIVFDVCCSSFVEEYVKSLGGTPIVNRVGHSFILNRMNQENAVFGGEYSNHLYFSEIFGLDDAIFGGLKLLEILSANGKTLANIVDSIPKYPSTNVESINCPDSIKFGVVGSLKNKIKSLGYKFLDLDGIKAFSDGGWFLIRVSNTNPTIKVNAEGKTPESARKLHKFAVDSVLKEISEYDK